MKNQRIVVALGGNALGATPDQQKEIVKETAKAIVSLAEKGRQIVVCHGNGPQVGMINLSFSLAHQKNSGKIPNLDLPEAGSMSQGYIGYHLQNAIINLLIQKKLNLKVATIVTQVEVDKNDIGFTNPSKPVGSFYTEQDANSLAKEYNWIVKEDSGRGWRRHVASPKPLAIVEKATIETLLNNNHIVIAGGGGGIPVYFENNAYHGVPAVIDKDWTAEKIASDIGANEFMIFTAVDYVSINYNTPEEEKLYKVTIDELEKHQKDHQFSAGSMLPKIEAAIAFVKNNPKKQAIIASLKNAESALQGNKGTIIVY